MWAPEYEQNMEEKQLHLARLQDGIDRKKAHIEKTIQVCIQSGTYIHLPASPDMHEYGGIKDGISRKKAHIEKTLQGLVLLEPCIPLPADPDLHASIWLSGFPSNATPR